MEPIHSSGCDCLEGQCMFGIEPASNCVRQLTGHVVTKKCQGCSEGGYTWHKDGVCLRCGHSDQSVKGHQCAI